MKFIENDVDKNALPKAVFPNGYLLSTGLPIAAEQPNSAAAICKVSALYTKRDAE